MPALCSTLYAKDNKTRISQPAAALLCCCSCSRPIESPELQSAGSQAFKVAFSSEWTQMSHKAAWTMLPAAVPLQAACLVGPHNTLQPPVGVTSRPESPPGAHLQHGRRVLLQHGLHPHKQGSWVRACPAHGQPQAAAGRVPRQAWHFPQQRQQEGCSQAGWRSGTLEALLQDRGGQCSTQHAALETQCQLSCWKFASCSRACSRASSRACLSLTAS